MKRLWPGWLLCCLTAALFTYAAAIESPGISALLGGLHLPDVVVVGYNTDAARALFDAFKADLATAEAQGRQSASAAYVSMHAGSDLLLPPMLAASLAFLAFAGLGLPGDRTRSSRLSRIGVGMVFALAFAYLGCDYVENAVADAMFGPPALAYGFNGDLAPVLRGLTIGKFSSLAFAVALISALWIRRLRKRP